MLLLYTRLFKPSTVDPHFKEHPSADQGQDNTAQDTELRSDQHRSNHSSSPIQHHLRQVQATHYLERRLFF